MVFWRDEKTAVPEDKPLRAELRTKKPSSHMTGGSGNLRQLVAFGLRGTLKRRKRDKKKSNKRRATAQPQCAVTTEETGVKRGKTSENEAEL